MRKTWIHPTGVLYLWICSGLLVTGNENNTVGERTTSDSFMTFLNDQSLPKTTKVPVEMEIKTSSVPPISFTATTRILKNEMFFTTATPTEKRSNRREDKAKDDQPNQTTNVKYFIVPSGNTNENIHRVVNNVTNEAIEDLMNKIGGSKTQIYIFAIVGVLPAAGALAWCVRWMLKRRKKGDRSQQESEDFCSVQGSTTQIGGASYIKSAESKMDAAPNKLLPLSRSKTNSFKEYDMQHQYYHHPQSWPVHHVLGPVPSVSPWEFPRNRLLLTEIIGEGNFGQVWKAEARYLNNVPGVVIVAVKTVKGNALPKDRHELLKELQVMQKLGRHPNVVTLLGCCTLQEPFYLIMEFVIRGKLLSFLRGHRSNRNYYNCQPTSHSLASRDLTMFAYQIVLGMEYIASKGIIHRDLAARNVLVDHNQVCKVADFGLARCVKDKQYEVYEQKSKGALPIRWMAPESLYMNVFTVKSDVWSFGVLLWEIVTLGSTPYPGMGPREVVHFVREGNVMDRPHHCRLELYKVMRGCWSADPKDRLNFSGLKKELGRLLELQTGYVDLEHFPENCYYNLYQSPGERV